MIAFLSAALEADISPTAPKQFVFTDSLPPLVLERPHAQAVFLFLGFHFRDLVVPPLG